MVDGGRTRLQRLARWSTSSPSASMTNWSDSKKHGTLSEANYFQPIDHENLVQGSLYIMKVKIVTIGLFEGWNDDMCCFSVLRSDTDSMRWSEARYLPGDFDAFDAFDDAGNPPVYFWTRHLRIQVPLNWFSLFEEARQRQRKWSMDVQRQYIYQQQQQQHHQNPSQQQCIDTTTTTTENVVDDGDEEDEILSFPAPPSSISSLPLDINGDTDLPLGSSFSQVRHGSPTIFTSVEDPPCAPSSTTPITTITTTTTTNKNDTYISPYPPLPPPPPPLPIDTHFPSASPSTTAAVAAFLTSSSAQSPHATKLDSQSSPHNDDPLVYSPVPSIRHSGKGAIKTQTTSATLSAAGTNTNTSNKSQSRRFSQQITNNKKLEDQTTLSSNHHQKSKFSRSMSIKSLSRKRMSVFGLF